MKHRRMSTLPLTIKDRSLWKRLIHEYDRADLEKMITHFHTYAVEASNFLRFYQARHDIHHKTRVKDYEWE